MQKTMDKQNIFISYCWKDGSSYADELEAQLEDKFKIIRDKTQLIANDDLFDFMADIANCDNVVIVLTEDYFFFTELYGRNVISLTTR